MVKVAGKEKVKSSWQITAAASPVEEKQALIKKTRDGQPFSLFL